MDIKKYQEKIGQIVTMLCSGGVLRFAPSNPVATAQAWFAVISPQVPFEYLDRTAAFIMKEGGDWRDAAQFVEIALGFVRTDEWERKVLAVDENGIEVLCDPQNVLDGRVTARQGNGVSAIEERASRTQAIVADIDKDVLREGLVKSVRKLVDKQIGATSVM